MTDTIQNQLDALRNLRLPDLQARYAEIVGEATRCPNKTFLLRRIGEALEAQAAAAQRVSEEDAPPVAAPVPPAESTDAAEAPQIVDAEPGTADASPMPNDVPEEKCTHDHVAEVLTLNDISEDECTHDGAEDATATLNDPPERASTRDNRERLRDLDVEALRARYVEVLGRSTRSRDRAYLLWKIHQAQLGRIPVGPVRRRQPGDPPVEHKVLPLRMPADTVDALDDAWRRRGFKNRMEFVRHALDAYLTHLGEETAASRVRGS